MPRQEANSETGQEKREENVFVMVVSLISAGLFGAASLVTADAPAETRRAMIEHGPEIMTWSFRIVAAGNLFHAGYRFSQILKGYLARETK